MASNKKVHKKRLLNVAKALRELHIRLREQAKAE